MHAMTNITIHKIAKDLGIVNSKKLRLSNNVRLVYNKMRAALDAFEQHKIGKDFVKSMIEKIIGNEEVRKEINTDGLNGAFEKGADIGKILRNFIDDIRSEGKMIDHAVHLVSKSRKAIEKSVTIKNFTKIKECTTKVLGDITVQNHIAKDILALFQNGVITHSQKDVLEKTALGMFDKLKMHELSGKSQRVTSSTIVWLSLMYHEKMLLPSEVCTIFNVSKSTLQVRARMISQELGFKKGTEIGSHGYLVPLRKNPALDALKKALRFTDTKNSLVEEIKNELIKLVTISKKSPEYGAARIIVIRALSKRGKMSEDEIKDVMNTAMGFRNGKAPHSTRTSEYKKLNHLRRRSYKTDASRGKSGCWLDGMTSLVERDGNMLHINTKLEHYMDEVLSPFNMFIDLCIEHRFNHDRCITAYSMLIGMIGTRDKMNNDLDASS